MAFESTSNTPHQTDDLINLAVPRRFYALVLRVLADAMAAETTAPGATSVAAVAESALGHDRPWTAEDVRRLHGLITNPTVRALMDLTCARPGHRVSFGEVQERAGCEFRQARADLAGLSRLVRRHFGRHNWPVNVTQVGRTLKYSEIGRAHV